ncbi:hypothetical protein J6590_012363 [Homalodisca vitripennis]|nr:hypothetical protein J6590_012363 [Homalodisca vitripennis]
MEAARIKKTLQTDHTNHMGSLVKANSDLTVSRKETSELLLETHSPGVDLHEYTSSLLQLSRQKKDSLAKTLRIGLNNAHPFKSASSRLNII